MRRATKKEKPEQKHKVVNLENDDKKKNSEKSNLFSEHVFPWNGTNILAFLFVTVLSLYSRLHAVEFPKEVVFDEVHFVSFAQLYASKRVVFDIHPPLGKLILGLVVHLTGFPTNQSYKDISTVYKHDGYITMRQTQATFGSMLAPIAFLSIRQLGCSSLSSFIGGLLIILELSLQTISRAVFLDPFLYFCIAISFFFALKMWRIDEERSGRFWKLKYWFYCFWCGIFMGCAFSTKHTGLGVIGVVGIIHIYFTFKSMIWFSGNEYPDAESDFVRRFIGGTILIILIIFVYFICFSIHFELNGEPYNYNRSLISNIIDVNLRMIKANSVSIFHHHHGSQYHEWPIHYRGLVYWWKELPDGTHICVYMFGNPLIYWLVLLVVLVTIVFYFFKILLFLIKRRSKINLSVKAISLGFCLFGWLANYLPYPLFIERTCFAYHYHPSLYFGILLVGVFFDFITQKMSERMKISLLLLFLIPIIVCYFYYLPFSYALPLTQDEHEERRMMYFFPSFRKIFPVW